MREGTLQFGCLLDRILCPRRICFASEEVNVDAIVFQIPICVDGVVFNARVVVGRGFCRCMQLGKMALEQVFVAEGAFAVLVRANEVAPTEVCDVMMCVQCFLLLAYVCEPCPES